MDQIKSKLKFSFTTEGNRIKEIHDPYCDFSFEFEVETDDLSTHQLFNVFEKVLAAMGYHEKTIMSGACSLAFNDMRSMELMEELVLEHELHKIPEEAEGVRKRRELYKGVEYSKKENGYEPA